MRTNASEAEGSTAALRGQGGTKAPPNLSRDDQENLRRAVALGRHVLHLLLEDGAGKELLRAGFALNEALGAWHRRAEPRLYGREAGGAP